MAYSFPVTNKQAAQAHACIEKHDKEKHIPKGKTFRYSGAIGGVYTWEFTSTTIGMGVGVKCSCGEEINVTDYDSW